MKYTDISFLFLFLPMGLLIYYILNDKYKNGFLLFLSLLFYFTISPFYLALMVSSVAFDFLMSHLMKKADQNMKKRAVPLFASVFKNILLIASAVYTVKHTDFVMPVGILVYTLSSLSYIIDVYEGEIPYETSFVDFALYNCFFGKIFFGPIVCYKDFAPTIKEKRYSLHQAGDGVVTLVEGIAFLKIIASPMNEAYVSFREICLSSPTILAVWGKLFSLAMVVYFALSGYCKIARGTASLFGLSLPHNMVYPYLSSSVKEFFASFNKSVSAFYGKYVFIPLGGAKNGVLVSCLNIILMCMLWGVWFGFEAPFVLWGIYMGFFICLEQYFLEKLFKKLPIFVSKVYTRIVCLFSFAIFGAESFSEGLFGFVGAFSFGKVPFFDTTTFYTIVSTIFPAILSLIFITKLPKKTGEFLKSHFEIASDLIIAVFNVFVMLFVIGYML